MVRFLIQRPIALIMSFVAIVVFSMIAATQLPVSLLPAIEVPYIVIKVNYPNAAPAEIEQNVLKPIRQSMATLSGLEDIESIASSESGNVRLGFAYGAAMNLAYIETNEKIDQLTDLFPRSLPRPQVMRVSTSDIPMVRVQVVPKSENDYLAVSELTEKVLKKRLEQLEGVSLVDINGLQQSVISITFNQAALQAVGITEDQLVQAVEDNNRELGSLSVKDGQYRYYLKVASRLNGADGLRNLPLALDSGSYIRLGKLAQIRQVREKIQGYHLFNGQGGLVITVHKQAQANMREVMPTITESVKNFEQDYPQINFAITQNQSMLLNAGISNLQTSLLYGGVFAFAVLFLFMGNYRSPLIIGISLPVSLVISFFLFYMLKLSINIISLSGLALGLGMLIDNAIIVMDNIHQKQQEGFSLIESCVAGVNEVITPLISSVLTTLAVFVPLIFLSGIGGALFYDQALSIAVILSISLLVAFVLLPLLYRLFFPQKATNLKYDSFIYRMVLSSYKRVFRFCFRHKAYSLIALLLCIPLLLAVGRLLPIAGLPSIEKNEIVLSIRWNEPLQIEESKQRVVGLLNNFPSTITEADIGLKQFLLQQDINKTDQVEVYMLFQDAGQKKNTSIKISNILRQNYPQASFQLTNAPNAFEQLFSSGQTYLEARIKDFSLNQPIPYEHIQPYLDSVAHTSWAQATPGEGFTRQTALELRVLDDRLSQYGVPYANLQVKLDQIFDDFRITEIKRFGEVTPILLRGEEDTFEQKIRSTYLRSVNGTYYPLNTFITYQLGTDYQAITADKSGIYQSLHWQAIEDTEVEVLVLRTKNLFEKEKFAVRFEGQYFNDRKDFQELMVILSIAVLLLYFILAAQFESLVQPLIVIATLPLGIGGALLLLWISDTSLNIMSAIGMVVALGIIVNDAILKIDTINRLWKESVDESSQNKKNILYEVIAKAGEMRLKPILMTSITTILALLPVIFTSGIGADLQRPLVIAVIGSLTVGTATAIFFIPLAFWYLKSLSCKLYDNCN